MGTTNFVDGITTVVADWLNDVDAHVYNQDVNPHPQYTTDAEATALATTVANVAIATHVGQSDPHTQYTTNAEVTDIATPIATTAANTAIDDHVALADPHTQYARGAQLAASSGSSLIGFLQSGTGAVSRTLQTRGREVITVTDFGAVGDGTTDDTAAIAAAITAASGKTLVFPDPSVAYKVTSGFTIPTNTKLVGKNKRTTKILKAFNGDLFTLGESATLSDLYIDGNGPNGFTGRGILITGTDGHQEVINCRIHNFKGFCVDYTDLSAGSQSIFVNCELSQYNAPTGSATNVAVNMLAGLQVSAVPRTFIGIQTNGTPAFNFGGCNDVFVSNSFLGDLYYTNNSRGVLVTGCRISNQASLVIDGHNNVIVGCDIAPAITIAGGSSADNISIMGNSYNSLPITDASGTGRNMLTTYTRAYTPTITSGGTPPSLGNGTINGNYTRNGSIVTFAAELITGSTTTLGTGGLYISIPIPTTSTVTQLSGSIQAYNGTTNYFGVGLIDAGDNKVAMLRDTSGSITFNSPSTWPTGSIFRVSGSYIV